MIIKNILNIKTFVFWNKREFRTIEQKNNNLKEYKRLTLKFSKIYRFAKTAVQRKLQIKMQWSRSKYPADSLQFIKNKAVAMRNNQRYCWFVAMRVQ